ncbi:MAG: hypothetical protein QXU83_04685, partial [Candidatus Bathyarchaeia archaeon]
MNENINVFAEFKLQCKKALKEALEKLGLFIDVKDLPLNEPPSIKFGELATSICFELSKKLSINPIELAKKIIENINLTKNDFNLIESIEEAGGG